MRYLKRLVGFSIISSIFALLAMAEDKPATPVPADDVIIKMDPYVVSGERVLPPPESWRYVQVPALELTRGKSVVVAPGYQILSNRSDKNTQLLVDELQLYQLAGAYLWPMIVQSLPREPIVIIVDQNVVPLTEPTVAGNLSWEGDPIASLPSASQISRYDSQAFSTGIQMYPTASIVPQAFSTDPTEEETTEASNRILPAGTPEPSPFKKKDKRPLPAGFTYVHAKNGALTVRVNAAAPLAASDLPTEEDIAADISRRLAEYVMFNFPSTPPQWFRVGLGWLIATTEATRTRITFAGVHATFTDTGAIPPLAPLLTKTTPLVFEEDLLAAAFTHWGLYGDNHSRTEKFTSLVEQQSSNQLTPEMFKNIMGITYEQAEREVASYGRSFANYKSHELRGSIPELPAFVVRDATQAEVARLKALDLVAIGKPEQALNELRIAYWRGEREPAMLALLADLEEKQGSVERAKRIIQGLAALKTPPTLTFLVDARLRFRELTATKKAGEKLTAKETGSIMMPLGRAIQAGVPNEPLCSFFAEVVLQSGGKPHESVRIFLEKATHRYPKNTLLREAFEFAQKALTKPENTATPTS